MPAERERRVAVGITGASGALYAVRTVAALLADGRKVELVVSDFGGWLAAGGRGGWEPWLLALAVGTWVAGFDILYACQDLDFDRAHRLRSIPARFGVARSLVIARGLHVVTVAALAAVALAAPLGGVYLAGVGGVALLLVWEQSLVRADDLSRVKQAFDLNGYVGLFYLAATAGALYVG